MFARGYEKIQTNQASSEALQVAQTPNGVALLVERRVFVLMVRSLEDRDSDVYFGGEVCGPEKRRIYNFTIKDGDCI